MSWIVGENTNPFLQSKIFSRKITSTIVEMQQLPDIEKVDSKTEISCLKWTIYSGRRKVCISFGNDKDKQKIVVYR